MDVDTRCMVWVMFGIVVKGALCENLNIERVANRNTWIIGDRRGIRCIIST